MPVLMARRGAGVVVAKSDPVAQSLPADAVMEAWTGGGNAIVASRGLLRVLIVDDNRDAVNSLSQLVKIWGHDPSVAYDGVEGLAKACAQLPDVLFIDIGMPNMDGFQLARQLRKQPRFGDTLLVAVTGWADEPHRHLWEGAFDHYLIKPVEPSELERLLRDRNRLVRTA